VAARIAARSLANAHAKAVREYRALEALRPLPPLTPSLLRRLRDSLRLPDREGWSGRMGGTATARRCSLQGKPADGTRTYTRL